MADTDIARFKALTEKKQSLEKKSVELETLVKKSQTDLDTALTAFLQRHGFTTLDEAKAQLAEKEASLSTLTEDLSQELSKYEHGNM